LEKQFYVYIMTNGLNTVLYTGMTSDLKQRVWQHKEALVEGFTKRYNIKKLVYYETAEDLDSALYREKQIKNYSRNKKIAIICDMNPQWLDLYDKIEE
jgi:putative endonuclease